ncbi:MAG: FecR family protein [Candidatus Dojkabacteria bacterium]|nr:FecR family protein [Candidatus Dojkabacteria bacterium]MDQ7020617.1 FecR family protein [Candidatus Dojkabacteria bacterium]
MEQTSNSQNLGVEEFFSGKAKTINPSNEFQSHLRDNVLQSYINFYDQKHMEVEKKTSIFKKYGMLLGSAFAIVFVVALAALFITNKDSDDKSENENIAEGTFLGAEVAFYDGDLELMNESGGWDDYSEGYVLEEGDSLRIAGAGRAAVNFDDGSAIRLNSNTEVTLSSLDPQNIVISNNSGEVYSRVVKSDRDFSIVADDIRYHSLGTAYKTINKENKKGVVVYESKVEILGINNNGDILVNQGEEFFLVNVDAPETANKVQTVNVDDLDKDEFIQWNKTQDSVEFKNNLGILDKANFKAESVTVEESNVVEVSTGNISASGYPTEEGVMINWEISEGLDVSKGFKVLKSFEPNPTFRGNAAANYISDSSVRTYFEPVQDGKSYHFRVCRYTGGSCDSYSADIVIQAPLVQVKDEPKTNPVPVNDSASISLSGSATADGITLNWSVSGSAPQGYKVVKSLSPNPAYGIDDATYIGDENQKSHYISVKDGKTYNFRVCIYTGNGCDSYSNNIAVTASSGPVAGVNSISLSSGGGEIVNWSTSGYAAEGFKVTYSKTAGPTYPARGTDKAQYASDPNTTSNYINAFDGAGTYFVRVCEYKSGTCGVYSNEITVNL